MEIRYRPNSPISKVIFFINGKEAGSDIAALNALHSKFTIQKMAKKSKSAISKNKEKNMQEKWTQWRPLSNLSDRYYIESISDNFKEGFKIILADAHEKTRNVLIHFPHSVNAYRRTDETFTLLTIGYLDKVYGGSFYANWTFFKAENSEYLKWLSEQSHTISDSYKIMHYALITDEEIIDIACTYEPTVTFLD